MKKLIFTLLLSTTSIYVWAQEDQDDEQIAPKTTSLIQAEQPYVHKDDHLNKPKIASIKPPNYGGLMIDWGFNFLRDHPSAMYSKSWGARFTNIGFHYNIHLGHSHFTLSPGIGLSFERYRLKESETLERDTTSHNTVFRKDKDHPKMVLSALDVRYLDVCMLEVRFNANSKYPKEGFFVALGGRLGMLWKACATIKYKEDSEKKERNSWETFNLNRIRYGVHARLGWERFGLCYTHILSSLFNENNGPSSTQPCSLGLSIDLF